MTRLVPLIVLLLLLPAASVLAGDLPQVLQPNATAYSVSEVAALTQAIATLSEALNDYDMAPRRYFSASEWNSRDFAVYTAGVLSGKGYNTEIVSGPGWVDGVHTWVLVGISIGTETAWIPVEASPEMGHSQQVLGHIPSTTDATGQMWFDAQYVAFGGVVELLANTAPIAEIRKPMSAIISGDPYHFLALTSVDPDGAIALYKWNFGDGQAETSVNWTIYHKYSEPGTYTVQLTVIDNRGKPSVSKSLRVYVAAEGEQRPRTAPSGGCGCGG